MKAKKTKKIITSPPEETLSPAEELIEEVANVPEEETSETIKVRFLRDRIGIYATYYRGMIIELPREYAQSLIKSGSAVKEGE